MKTENTESDMGFDNEHIVMLPFIAKGHLIPFLALAKAIQQRTGFTITIATTPLNLKYIQATICSTPCTNSNIHLAELSFRSEDHGLPPNTENTEILPPNNMLDLCAATMSLEAPARCLILDIIDKEGRPPLCIISDLFYGWATNLAENLGTTNVTFAISGAYGTAALVSFWHNLPHRSIDSDEFTMPGFVESSPFHITQLDTILRASDGTNSLSRFFQPQFSLSTKSFGWLCNTAEAMEPLGLEILRNYLRLPVWSIGPLLPRESLNNSSTLALSVSRDREDFLEWLDSQGTDSVIYISFGSQNTISASQMMALAVGLEDRGRTFIWVIRPPVGYDLKGEFKAEWLPLGFTDRISKRRQGFLVHNWAPQLEISGWQ